MKIDRFYSDVRSVVKNVIIIALGLTLISSCSLFHEPKKDPLDSGEIWASAYLASWHHRVNGTVDGKTWGNLYTEDIDWEAFTHLFYFNLLPNPDGTLPPVIDYENVNPDRVISIVESAHQHNKPILISIGGFNSRDEFVSAFSDDNRDFFIQNLVDFVNTWGFDGIDLDMQPLEATDADGVIQFVNQLHAALQDVSTPILDKPLLTASVVGSAEIYAQVQEKFDQINIATYNMSRPFQGWVTWHNTPLYNGGHTFPMSGNFPLPSIELKMQDYLTAGIERKKLGIAASFYGYEWSGVSSPREGWDNNNVPTVPWYGGTPYFELAEKYDLENPLWDKDARVPYLSITDPETFVSFDNVRSIEEKIDFVRSEGLGGLLIWEIAGGFRENEDPNKKDVLLQAVKTKLNQFN
ncbi:MAG TPA: glycoside hydrolase family 18 protein [Gracilimonas sp.]|uniref:glycoside hydrolase family 18 protein n=1 Tax=Gracilimonas sp. TaxID=1974203 RepID=UPI002D85F368|nr:glycoside hydrolase family 18 protein [Gracilimonas sp.]